MRIPRIFHATPLSIATTVELDEKAAHHINRVLRLPTGSNICLFNGDGKDYPSTLLLSHKNRVTAHIDAQIDNFTTSQLTIHLGQVISRGDRMDLTLQKAVELGVDAITPLTSTYCGVKLQAERWEKKLQHWQGIIIHACEQSGRSTLPKLHPPLSLQDWILQTSAQHKLVLDPLANTTLSNLSYQKSPENLTDFAMLIGSEGGLSAQEMQAALTQGFTSIRLGPRILRTETAGLAVLSALQALYGDFK